MLQHTEQTESPSTARPTAVQLRARRSPAIIAFGVLLVVVGGLGSAALFTLNSDQRAVVIAAADIRRGDVIENEDLGVVEVPESLAVDAVGADQLPTLVGQHALTDLPKGSFPLPAHVGEEPLPDGESLVGLRLPLGRLPVTDMPPGTTVRLVSLAEGSSWSAPAEVAARPVLLDDGGTYSVDVRVAEADATEVARLSATDQLALIVVTGEP